jgi:hypothetical protein
MEEMLKRIHSTAPVRICDVGGWADTWFAQHGAVFNIGVTPYVEVQITTFWHEEIRGQARLLTVNLGFAESTCNPFLTVLYCKGKIGKRS